MLEFKKVNERSRVYIFPNQEVVDFGPVDSVGVTQNTHRLNLVSGQKAIVSNEWLAIVIEADEWTF